MSESIKTWTAFLQPAFKTVRRLLRKSRVIDEISCHRNSCLINVESNHYHFVNALLRSVIGPENLHHFFNQSDSKLKPITTGSPAFSRVSGCLVVFYLDLSYGSVRQKLLLRQSRQSTEPFKQVLPWAIYRFNSAIYIIITYLVSLCRSPGKFQFSSAYFARECCTANQN